MDIIKKNEGQYINIIEVGENGLGKRVEINITIWANVPKIEIYTSRGMSFVAEGEQALYFAHVLKSNIIDTLLIEGGTDAK